MTQRLQTQIRGLPVDVRYFGHTLDQLWWWLDGWPESDLTDYERLAIEAKIRAAFIDARNAWIARKARLRVVQDMRRRGAL